MAAYSAFVSLHHYLSKNPQLERADAIAAIRHTNSDAFGLDFVGATGLCEILNLTDDWSDTKEGLRLFVFEYIKATQPWWLRMVPYGREKVRSALERDQVQCLREAGLFDPVPDAETVAWWDEIGALVRGTVDAERMIRAREAERLSLEHERARLKTLGIDKEPKWVSLEDNTLGYDIQSYDVSDGSVVNRLIEVKSTTSDAIFITRNEWQNAATADQHYFFHVWKMPEATVEEYSVSTIKPNIPTDQGSGLWQDVRVELGGGLLGSFS